MNISSVTELNMQVKEEALFLQDLLVEINKVMVGQEALVERVLIGLLADGHISRALLSSASTPSSQLTWLELKYSIQELVNSVFTKDPSFRI